jgi:HPt (histidine-containing phosphotransfer) domain-containing protein
MDVARGLSVVRGKTDKYLKLLQLFVESHAEDMTQLAARLAAGDLTAARLLSHTLKGTGATLGANHLAAKAARLEGLLRARQNDPNEHARTDEIEIELEIEAIRQEITALAAVLPPAPTHALAQHSTSVDPKALSEVLEKLDLLLEQSDTAALSLFSEHAELLRAALGQPYEELERQIKRFDFEAASHTLRAKVTHRLSKKG